MHSSSYEVEGERWHTNHNGDYSGDVHIHVPTYHPNHNYEHRVEFYDMSRQRGRMRGLLHTEEDLEPDYYEVKLPYELLESIVADKIRMDIMERIEDMDHDELMRYLAQKVI